MEVNFDKATMNHFQEELETYFRAHAFGTMAKVAGVGTPTYSLSGRLYLSSTGWLMLSVPNQIVRGLYDAINELGAELPYNKDGVLNAHCTVMSPEEVEQAGGSKAIAERGHSMKYNLGQIKSVTPDSWDGISKVWYVTVDSPDLRKVRTSYGLTPTRKDHDQHITFAIRKKGVLYDNDVAKTDVSRIKEIIEKNFDVKKLWEAVDDRFKKDKIKVAEDNSMLRTIAGPSIVVGASLISLLANKLALKSMAHYTKKLRPISKKELGELYVKSGLPADFPTYATLPDTNNAFYASGGDLAYIASEMDDSFFNNMRNRDKYEKARKLGIIGHDPSLHNAAILGHEAGHAEIAQRPWYSPSRINQNVLRPVGSLLSMAAPAAAGAAGIGSKNIAIGGAAGLAAGLLSGAPTLINEWQASNNARRYLAGSSNNQQEIDNSRKALRRAFATYLLGSLVLPTATGALAGGIANLKRAEQTKTADSVFDQSADEKRRIQQQRTDFMKQINNSEFGQMNENDLAVKEYTSELGEVAQEAVVDPKSTWRKRWPFIVGGIGLPTLAAGIYLAKRYREDNEKQATAHEILEKIAGLPKPVIKIRAPKLSVPKVSIPRFSLPKIEEIAPRMLKPSIPAPEIRLPEVKVPELAPSLKPTEGPPNVKLTDVPLANTQQTSSLIGRMGEGLAWMAGKGDAPRTGWGPGALWDKIPALARYPLNLLFAPKYPVLEGKAPLLAKGLRKAPIASLATSAGIGLYNSRENFGEGMSDFGRAIDPSMTTEELDQVRDRAKSNYGRMMKQTLLPGWAGGDNTELGKAVTRAMMEYGKKQLLHSVTHRKDHPSFGSDILDTMRKTTPAGLLGSAVIDNLDPVDAPDFTNILLGNLKDSSGEMAKDPVSNLRSETLRIVNDIVMGGRDDKDKFKRRLLPWAASVQNMPGYYSKHTANEGDVDAQIAAYQEYLAKRDKGTLSSIHNTLAGNSLTREPYFKLDDKGRQFLIDITNKIQQGFPLTEAEQTLIEKYAPYLQELLPK